MKNPFPDITNTESKNDFYIDLLEDDENEKVFYQINKIYKPAMRRVESGDFKIKHKIWFLIILIC